MKKITYLTPKNPIPYSQLIHKDFWAYGYYLDLDQSSQFAALCEASSDRDLMLEIIPFGSTNIILRTEYSVDDERIKKAIRSIENECINEIYDMNNPLFWGCSSKQELNEYLQKSEDCFYRIFLKSIATNSPKFIENEEDLQRYEIGKSLIFENPNLIFDWNKKKLLLRINASYRDKALSLASGESANRIAWCINEPIDQEDIPF
jgi:hypothetical protein